MADYTIVFDLIYHQQETRPRLDSLAAKVNGSWKKWNTDEVIDMANQVSKALLALGVKPGDTIALVSNNRPEWNFVDIGVQQIGAINVPVYPTISDKEYAYIFNDAKVRFCFLGNADLYQKISGIADNVSSLEHIFTFDEIEGARNWSEILTPVEARDLEEIEALKEAVTPDDLATLIYTSGTTGNPKGVMLTHKNLVSNVRSVAQVLPLTEGSRALSFLPLCHSFERTVSNSYIASGVSIYYAENLETIGENLKEVKPEFFSTVPRLLEKVYEKIMAAGRELTGFKRKLFFWATELASEYDLHEDQGWWYNTRLKIARRLIFSKWREALGGEIVCICTGAAAIQPRLATLFTAGGIDVIEGYGLTETAPVLAVNRLELENRHIGTVGLPIPDVEIRIAEDGEILARGPNVMKGYYNKPELTAEVIDKDGWFHTGDVGEFVKGKFLKITDRKKELFKTSGGKYVAPQPIENKFKESPLIEQIAVIGNNRKFVSALIVPSFLALEDYCKRSGLSAADIASEQGRMAVLSQPEIRQEYDRQIAAFNKDINHVEQVKKYKLLPAEWSVESGELTPTMKPKRKIIYERYSGDIEEIYGS